MAYKANIPQATDLISVSQADLLENFTQLAGMVNPVTGVFGALKMEAGVAPATLATQIALYCKNNGAGTPSLFYRSINNGTERDLSTLTTVAHPPLGWETQYSFNLPNGLIVKFSRCDQLAIGTATANVVFDTPFPTKGLWATCSIMQIDAGDTWQKFASLNISIVPYAQAPAVDGVTGVRISRQAAYTALAVDVWWLAIGN
jgi:hypothetical protein